MKIEPEIKNFFGKGRQVVIARAPGRLDIMGGISEYSGGLVLEKTIAEQATVYVAARADGLVRVQTRSRSVSIRPRIEVFVPELSEGWTAPDLESIKTQLNESPKTRWALYLAGCLLVLVNDKKVFSRGVDIWLHSDVPMACGVASSSAIEMATLSALDRLYNVNCTGAELARLAQKVENTFVGTPCGIMDQLTACLGEAGKLLPIICQNARAQPLVEIPADMFFVGIDSGIANMVTGNEFISARVAAFMGYSIIALQMGASTKDLKQAARTGDTSGLPLGGHLANLSPQKLEKELLQLLPDEMTGNDFLQQYGISIDQATSVEADQVYRVKACTGFPVYENYRTHQFIKLLNDLHGGATSFQFATTLKALGELMSASHAGYTRCGLGHERTNELIEAIFGKGPDQYLYGARVTGKGNGGMVAVLCRGKTGVDTARKLGREFARKHGYLNTFFEGDSNGSSQQIIREVILN